MPALHVIRLFFPDGNISATKIIIKNMYLCMYVYMYVHVTYILIPWTGNLRLHLFQIEAPRYIRLNLFLLLTFNMYVLLDPLVLYF